MKDLSQLFIVCSFSFLPNFLDSPVFWKSFLYSGLLAAVRIVGHTDLWCVAGCNLVK